jgi:aminopeptidase-like protein
MIVTNDAGSIGSEMHALASELFPICRSLTGDGVRRTLDILRNHIPLTCTEVPSGKPVFDWVVPNEWNIRDAWIRNEQGDRVVDFQANNLHVVSYSTPVRARMPLAELRPHLHSLPDNPDWIPYRTSYYKESWGFCLSDRQLQRLADGSYDVCIDSTLAPGHLTIGECYLPGESQEEVLLSAHVCHPSLANDNLSGISLAVALATRLQEHRRRYSYRFLFIPGTIGSITWLALNEGKTKHIRHGLVLTCLGDKGSLTYKRSRRGSAEIDRAATHILRTAGEPHRIIDFFPYGYDERQYCSPGFDLAVGCFMRSQHGTFPEYHTSADDLSFIRPAQLANSFERVWEVIEALENNRTYLNTNPKCEPRLGKRGLYGGVGGTRHGAFDELGLLWVLNQSDGKHDLLAIAERAGMRFSEIQRAAAALHACGLLEESIPAAAPCEDANPASVAG